MVKLNKNAMKIKIKNSKAYEIYKKAAFDIYGEFANSDLGSMHS